MGRLSRHLDRNRQRSMATKMSTTVAATRQGNLVGAWSRENPSGRCPNRRMRPTYGQKGDSPHPDDVSSLTQLMCRVNADDQDAFADLMKTLEKQIHVYCNWTLQSNVADLEQELWTALWLALRRKPPRVLQEFCSGGEHRDI